jgi:cold-inducible RNA-binding protein
MFSLRLVRQFHASPQALSKIYVGNLAWAATEDSLRHAFAKFGPLSDVFIVRDRLSGRSKGFGFLEFESDQSAKDAIAQMNEVVFEGRNLRVNAATEKPRQEMH